MTLKLLTLAAIAPDGSRPFVDALKKALSTADTPARTGYWLSKLTKKVNEEVAVFDEVRQKLLAQFGKPVEGDEANRVMIPAEHVTQFQSELMSLERDVDLGLPDGLLLDLPPKFVPADFAPLIASLDVFNEPT